MRIDDAGVKIAATFFGMMVAREGVEPPTPAFSGATGAVLTVTYRDVEGCETPVRACKASEERARTTGSARGDSNSSAAQISSDYACAEPWTNNSFSHFVSKLGVP